MLASTKTSTAVNNYTLRQEPSGPPINYIKNKRLQYTLYSIIHTRLRSAQRARSLCLALKSRT
jgi:hypothetical protein